jgi:hypothetical protein
MMMSGAIIARRRSGCFAGLSPIPQNGSNLSTDHKACRPASVQMIVGSMHIPAISRMSQAIRQRANDESNSLRIAAPAGVRKNPCKFACSRASSI